MTFGDNFINIKFIIVEGLLHYYFDHKKEVKMKLTILRNSNHFKGHNFIICL